VASRGSPSQSIWGFLGKAREVFVKLRVAAVRLAILDFRWPVMFVNFAPLMVYGSGQTGCLPPGPFRSEACPSTG
ncbi:MAG: hypothetical protein ACK53L_14840, partial [Pirellulaceae bacterium]